MSKNRLDESTIRRFMGLAGIQPLGENFLDRLQEEEPEEVPMDDMAAEEPPMDAEPAPEMDAEPAPEAGEAAAEIAQDVASAVADAMTQALSKHGVTVDAGEGGEEMAPVEEPAPEMEPPMDAEPAPEMDAEEPALEETANTTEAEEETLEENTPEDDALTQLETVTNDLEEKEEVVQEVARRVVKRLLDTIQK